MDDLINRLRCKYPSGPLINGEPEFGWRDFSGPAPEGMILPSPLMLEAALEIERLQARVSTLEHVALILGHELFDFQEETGCDVASELKKSDT